MLKASIVRRRCALRAMLAAGGLLVTGATLALEDPAPQQSLASIRAAAEAQVRAQLHGVAFAVHVQAADLDPRLHLVGCPQALTASQLGTAEPAARVTVRVSCTVSRQLWSLYVPVSVESEIPVLVLRQSQIRGARLGPQEVVLETRRVPGLGGAYVNDVAALAHRTLSRPVPAGTALMADLFQSDLLVRQGQSVTLVAAGPGIEVRAPARALEDAREGAHVRVQNLASQRIVQGVVDANGLIYATP
jgi:flagellar basal body P-ring formation protein FlgA